MRQPYYGFRLRKTLDREALEYHRQPRDCSRRVWCAPLRWKGGRDLERLRRRSAKRVREANERAAEAEARAEEANKQTKELELALAKLKAPRGLSLTKIGQIGEELAEFAGTKYVIGVSFPHSELAGLRACIEEILREADWTEVECPAFIDINTMPSDDGVGISVTLDSSDMNSLLRTGQFVALVRAGMALSAALNREGVETREQVTLVPLPPGEDAIMYIMIGPKI